MTSALIPVPTLEKDTARRGGAPGAPDSHAPIKYSAIFPPRSLPVP